ncbi:MAG: GerAB/ArcD/ProY family transporter [Peptococcaceae bacterium]|nr:GerAB/ArcD/ProY family transporter [Peptococcaceae bacterium]
MGSSKLISNREMFQMVLLLQQGGLFWLLPYLLIGTNGTIGLISILPGVAVGLLIILVCAFWGKRCREQSFPQSLTAMLGRPFGTVTGMCFMLLYLVFAVICLSSFVEVLSTQLFSTTPRLAILVPVFLLAGWLAWNGLEDIARLLILCIVLAVCLFLLALAGSIGNFAPENMLPLQINDVDQLRQSALHSIFFYSSLLVLFMVYPARNQTRHAGRQLAGAMVLSTAVFLLWVGLALGVFGQFSTGSLIWLPLELARMIRIGSFLERTEALFTAMWMPIVLVNSGLLLWSVTESAHQLLHKQKSRWLHWSIVLLAAGLCVVMRNLLQLFYVEQVLSVVTLGLVPVLLAVVLLGTVVYSRKKEGQAS